jgi:quercetin dioxygenase-like cupin family protein
VPDGGHRPPYISSGASESDGAAWHAVKPEPAMEHQRDSAMNYRIDFATVRWETPMKGVRHKVMKQGDRQLRLVEYTKDLEPHWCEKGHIGYVLDGQLEITFDNERVVYNPGDGVFIPAGSEHKHMGRVLSDFVRVIFVEDA